MDIPDDQSTAGSISGGSDAISHAVAVVSEALGWRTHQSATRLLAQPLAPHLDAQFEHPTDSGRTAESELPGEFARLDNVGLRSDDVPLLSVARWPGDAPFALFLSHDVDQIHDREFFRVLADLNHVRRRVTRGEPGNVALALRRVARSLFCPKPAIRDFETLIRIESQSGFRSTFYLLHDPYWSRHGPRYTLHSKALHRIVNLIRDAGGEIGVHGGYYRFNDAEAYRESRDILREIFDIDAVGIRNHYLRFSYPETWRAQEAAGFSYDATFGWRRHLGSRAGLPFPFRPYDPVRNRVFDLLELPLTAMDTPLFRHIAGSGPEALERAWSAVARVGEIGGLVSLLWHNNFFNEPEYADWQSVYEQLLSRLAPLEPWCATGAEISEWWRRRSHLRWEAPSKTRDTWTWRVEAGEEIEDVVLKLRGAKAVPTVTVDHSEAQIVHEVDTWRIAIPHLEKGGWISVKATFAE